MTVVILAVAAGWVGWLGYQIGQARAELRARAARERMLDRLNRPWPPPGMPRVEP